MPFVDITSGSLQATYTKSYSSDMESSQSSMSSMYQPTTKKKKGLEDYGNLDKSFTALTATLTSSTEEIQKSFSNIFKREQPYHDDESYTRYDDSGYPVTDDMNDDDTYTQDQFSYSYNNNNSPAGTLETNGFQTISSSVTHSMESPRTIESGGDNSGIATGGWSAIPAMPSREEERDDQTTGDYTYPSMERESNPYHEETEESAIRSTVSEESAVRSTVSYASTASWEGTEASREVSLLDTVNEDEDDCNSVDLDSVAEESKNEDHRNAGGGFPRRRGSNNTSDGNHDGGGSEEEDDEYYSSDEYDEFEDVARLMYKVGSCAYPEDGLTDMSESTHGYQELDGNSGRRGRRARGGRKNLNDMEGSIKSMFSSIASAVMACNGGSYGQV